MTELVPTIRKRLSPLMAALAVLLVLAASRWFHRQHAQPAHPPVPADEEATPDCGLAPPTQDPLQERASRLASLGVERWHAAGIRGKGIKIAVLDTGFRGYRSLLGKVLPSKVQVRCFRSDGDFEGRDSQHGLLCAEVLHVLAPEAEMLLATWEPNRPDQFLEAVQWARRQGANIISCSVIMPSWSDGEGGGAIHDALGRIVGSGANPGDALLVASAGNTARRHWSGPFTDGGNRFHAWRARQLDNRIRPWGDERVSVELCCPPGCRYQVTVRDAANNSEVGRSASAGESNRGCAVVRFIPEPGRRYRMRVQHLDGPALPFHVVVLGGDLDFSTREGSIPFPGDGEHVLAIGAVDADGLRMGYSSCGPNSKKPKPDFVAFVPFPSLFRDRPFTGTSAAAPQAAGVAALCWSRCKEWNAGQVREALRRWARDLGPVGHDWETGWGLAVLPPP